MIFDIRLLLAALTVYRLAQLVSEDDGPLFIFKRLRIWTDIMAKEQQERGNELGFWVNVNEGLHCPFCTGFYASFLVAYCLIYPNGYQDAFLLVMALAGAQSMLQRITK